MTKETEAISNGLNTTAARVLLFVALGLGAGNGATSIYSGSVAVTNTELVDKLALRDEKISHLVDENAHLRRDLEQLEENNPPPQLIAELRAALQRIRELERRLDTANL